MNMTGLSLALSGLILFWTFSKISGKYSFTQKFLILFWAALLPWAWNIRAHLPGMAEEALVGLSFQFFLGLHCSLRCMV